MRLLQVDDVDAAALAEDERLHLGVPAPGLVAEVDAGLQQLLHRERAQGAPCRGCVRNFRREFGGPPMSGGTDRRPGDHRGGGRGRNASGESTRLRAPLCDLAGDGSEIGWEPGSSSIGSPVSGCANARRQACRNWRPSPRLSSPAVDGIADHRMAGRLEVDANLVGAPGLEAHVEEASAPNCLQAQMGDGLATADRFAPPSQGLRRSRPIGRSMVSAGGTRRAQTSGTGAPPNAPASRLQVAVGPGALCDHRAGRWCRGRAGGRCRGGSLVATGDAVPENPCTRVPLSCPLLDGSPMPAGFSTTIRSSSS